MKPKNKSFFNLEATLEHDIKEFASKDPQEVAYKSGALYDATKMNLELTFLQGKYFISYPEGKIKTEEAEKASLYDTIIILHYLNTADGTPLDDRWISFKELTGGHLYAEPFRNRALVPFIKTFGDNPALFLEKAKGIGGFSARDGKDFSMVIPVLPRVAMNFILYPGDEEFPPSGNILIDSRANCYLPTEDYAHIPGLIVRKMAGK